MLYWLWDWRSYWYKREGNPDYKYASCKQRNPWMEPAFTFALNSVFFSLLSPLKFLQYSAVISISTSWILSSVLKKNFQTYSSVVLASCSNKCPWLRFVTSECENLPYMTIWCCSQSCRQTSLWLGQDDLQISMSSTFLFNDRLSSSLCMVWPIMNLVGDLFIIACRHACNMIPVNVGNLKPPIL